MNAVEVKTDDLTLDEQRAIQKAAVTETARGASVGVAVLKSNGKIISRGYTYPGWAFKWANAEIEYGSGVVGYLYNAEEYHGDYWRFSKDQRWEAF